MKGMICLLRFKIVFNFDWVVYTVSSCTCTRACPLTNGHPLYMRGAQGAWYEYRLEDVEGRKTSYLLEGF